MRQVVLEPLQIGAIGLDERRCNALSMIFEGACRKNFCFAKGGLPEAWIVDLDQVGAVDALAEKWRTQGRRPTLFLAVSTPAEIAIDGEKVNATFLKKPFRVEDFVAALPQLVKAARPAARPTPAAAPVAPVANTHRIHDKLGTAGKTARVADLMTDEVSASLAGNAADIDLADPAQHEQIYYAPGRFLQGVVARVWENARRAGRPVALEGPWPSLVFFPADNKVQLGAALRQYRPFAIVPDLQDAPRETVLNPNVRPAGECIGYESFVWTLALWAARGRLPRDTPLDAPVFLRTWPNFTRLDISPSALAIAALWVRQPHSLTHTIEALQLPQRWVFALYSATHAVNLSDVSRRAVDYMAVPNPPAPLIERRSGFLSRVLGKLRLAR